MRRIDVRLAAGALIALAVAGYRWRRPSVGIMHEPAGPRIALSTVVTVAVRSYFGPPVGGAVVQARRLAGTGAPASEVSVHAGTDEQSTFRMSLEADDYLIEARHPGFAVGSVQFAAGGADGDRVEIVLVPASSIRGHVLDRETGAAVEGATVVARGELAVGSSSPELGPRSAVTDAEGSFTLEGLRPGILSLTARRDDLVSTEPEIVTLPLAAQVTGADVRVERGRSISGAVAGRGAELRVRGAWVSARDVETGETVVAAHASDDHGRFTVHGLAPGRYVLGARRGENGPPVENDQPTIVGEGDVEETTVAMDTADAMNHPAESSPSAAAGWMLGRVVDAQGDPVSDVRVMVTSALATPDQLRNFEQSAGSAASLAALDTLTGRERVFRYAKTGRDGAFEARGLPEGAYELRVYGASGRRAWRESSFKDAPEAPILADVGGSRPAGGSRLVVESCPGVVRGWALNPDGTPAGGAWIAAGRERPRSLDVAALRSTVAAADGAFSFTELCDGSYRLVAYALSTMRAASRRALHPGGEASLTLAGLSSVTGHVSSGGQAVADGALTLIGPDRRRQHWHGARGTFRLQGLVPGTYQLVVQAEAGYSVRSLELRSNANEDVLFDLSPWSSVHGQLARRGQPVANAEATLYFDPADPSSPLENTWPAGARLYRTRTDGAGRFAFDHLVARAARLSFASAGAPCFVENPQPGSSGAPAGAGRFIGLELEIGADRDLGTVVAEGY